MALPMVGPYGLKLLCKGRARKRAKLSPRELGPVCLVQGGVTHVARGVGRCRVESAQLNARAHAAVVHCMAERFNPGLSVEKSSLQRVRRMRGCRRLSLLFCHVPIGHLIFCAGFVQSVFAIIFFSGGGGVYESPSQRSDLLRVIRQNSSVITLSAYV